MSVLACAPQEESMTKQKAIEVINLYMPHSEIYCDLCEALQVAVEALNAQILADNHKDLLL